MSIAKQAILLNGVNLHNGTLNLTEWIDYSWAQELAFIIDIQQTTGSPAAGTVTAKFQKRVPHKTGAIQFNNQRLVDLSAEEKVAWIVEGDFPVTLADFSLASPVTYQRSVRNFGAGVNLALTVAGLSGGTSPGFQITAIVVAKGL